jgi:threonyl-tRNA synthetase
MGKAKQDKETALYRFRHSLAHVLAQAVLETRPKAKLGFGPPIDTGFYYDFDFQGEPLAASDLADLETRMRRIIKERQRFVRTDVPAADAIQRLEAAGQSYKVEYAPGTYRTTPMRCSRRCGFTSMTNTICDQ